MQVYIKKESNHSNISHEPFISNRKILREQFNDIRDELFPDNWNIAVDNWTHKKYCTICKSSITSSYNCFKIHSNDFHDDFGDIVKPWIRWKGIRTKE